MNDLIKELTPYVAFVAMLSGVFLSMYAALPKAFRVLGFVNNFIDDLHGWFKRNILIPEIYLELADHETRIVKLETPRRGRAAPAEETEKGEP